MVTTDYAQGEQTEQVIGGTTKRNADTKSRHKHIRSKKGKSAVPLTP